MTEPRWLVVGLGNPGKKYARTRHTLGARVVQALKASLRQPAFRASRALRARVSHGERLLAVPTTFMNESGQAVRLLLKKYRIPLDRLLIVHDDKDLAFGTMKFQKGRSSAGHRGVQSVIDTLGSKNFWRFRLGIEAPPNGVALDAYVLHAFTEHEEAALIRDVIQAAVEALRQQISR